MSSELSKARQQLASIRTSLRQGKAQPAVKALHSTVLIILQTPLMKSERDEFERLLEDAVYMITSDKNVKEIYAEPIEYTPGKERELLDNMSGILQAFDLSIKDEASEAMKLLAQRRDKLFEEGAAALAKGDEAMAENRFNALMRDFGDDSELLGRIGELYLNAGEYDKCIPFLEKALKDSPELAHLYNKIAMALRKTKQFEKAEEYYLKAYNYLGKDPNLFFNMGRLYMDMGLLDKAIKTADAAVTLDPNFVEAAKLAAYLRKQQEKQSAQ